MHIASYLLMINQINSSILLVCRYLLVTIYKKCACKKFFPLFWSIFATCDNWTVSYQGLENQTLIDER